jgi:shikimate kinase
MSSDLSTKEDIPSSKHKPLLRLVLTGFMGSGKTTVGRLLANRLGWRFVDLDDEIERADGRTVATIFAESGEQVFRQLETAALASILRASRVVLALGGGALETPDNRELLAASLQTLVLLLTAPFETLYDRCVRQNAETSASGLPVRPLLGDADTAAARLARRDGVYRSAAGLILETHSQTPEETAQSVLRAIEGKL